MVDDRASGVFTARSAKASLEAFIKAYESRPVVEITLTMVAAGMRAIRAGLEDTAERVFLAMMRGAAAAGGNAAHEANSDGVDVHPGRFRR